MVDKRYFTCYHIAVRGEKSKLDIQLSQNLSRDRPRSDDVISENWMMIGRSSTKIHCKVRAMVVNRSLTLNLLIFFVCLH